LIRVVYIVGGNIYALFTKAVILLFQNIKKELVIQVVPQLDNGPEEEGAWPVLKIKETLEGSPGPFSFFMHNCCLAGINGLQFERVNFIKEQTNGA
jgi:hypothetical protein